MNGSSFINNFCYCNLKLWRKMDHNDTTSVYQHRCACLHCQRKVQVSVKIEQATELLFVLSRIITAYAVSFDVASLNVGEPVLVMMTVHNYLPYELDEPLVWQRAKVLSKSGGKNPQISFRTRPNETVSMIASEARVRTAPSYTACENENDSTAYVQPTRCRIPFGEPVYLFQCLHWKFLIFETRALAYDPIARKHLLEHSIENERLVDRPGYYDHSRIALKPEHFIWEEPSRKNELYSTYFDHKTLS